MREEEIAQQQREQRQNARQADTNYGMARMRYGLEKAEPLIRLGRAIADPMRVRILAVLAQRSMYGQELAEQLDVSTPTISHHMALLRGAGLIKVRKENNYHHYELEAEGFKQASSLLTLEHLRSIGAELQHTNALVNPTQEDDRQMVESSFFEGERLLSIPRGTQGRRYVMEKIARAFEWGRIYEEVEVNAILKPIYTDVPLIRRELINQKLMMRENGRYWLIRPPHSQEA
ncbi:hypothetical protein KSC_075830 [Ktedonobacter sp. SOSP1-52]|uniref:DUF2087 domain-containing protein n=1 Tax=Ktedonobacter sp. SOSP1-52 TaxID=2778366 RepID=UPI001915B5FA|nr:metalloregulator ArsR/SmtB family transcription factor [Ktedonobacter sp. SOSP1-52]GHO68691.1 hypothetical protein KSC_075830 [Ktedonobacter sp. SOSP1-52]